MRKSIKLDKIDRHILDILQTNGKITNAELAQRVGLSPAPTLERVKKLEKSGILKSYHAQVDYAKVGLGVSTFVRVSLKSQNMENIQSFVSGIENIDEIVECHHITGSGDFILKIIAPNIPEYQKLMLEKVTDIDVVANMQSMIILSTFKDSKKVPIP